MDFVYLDPPYLGTTIGRDKRYARQLGRDELIEGVESLIERGARFALSYDGMTGGRSYGPPLPEALGLSRLLLDAGVSSQATLSGRSERTVESLYLSPGLVANGAPVEIGAS
jgi:DNA adenine methylase